MTFSAADRKSTRLNSSHSQISYAVFCLKKKSEHDGDVVVWATDDASQETHGTAGAAAPDIDLVRASAPAPGLARCTASCPIPIVSVAHDLEPDDRTCTMIGCSAPCEQMSINAKTRLGLE